MKRERKERAAHSEGAPQERLAELFNNRTFVAVLSLVAALVFWAAVAFSNSTEIETTLHDVPVTLAGGAYTSYGLDIMNANASITTVDVRVRGPRAVVGKLGAGSVIVTPNFTRVTAAGAYDLTLASDKANPSEQFEIIAVTPGAIRLQFDTPSSKRFEINTSEVLATAAEGYVIEQITADPGEVTVTGSEEELARIDRIAVKYRFDQELSRNERVQALELLVYDSYGNEMSKETLKISGGNTVDITVPVYKLSKLALDIGFINMPEGFDVSTLDYALSVEELEIAGVESRIDTMSQPWIIGYVDLRTFELGREYTFNIELPKGLVNRGSGTVTVTFPRDGMQSKRINVTDIRLENAPTNYTIKIVTAQISDVTVLGPARDVEALLPQSVVAVVDFSQMSTVERGRYSVPVAFRIAASNTTWVVGSYTVIIDVETS